MPESNTPISNPPEFTGSIEINPGDRFQVDQQAITSVTRRIVADAGFTRGSISIAVVDDATIHQLNRQYLQHDYPTDVLSFPLASDAAAGILEGEIVVSYETASRSAMSRSPAIAPNATHRRPLPRSRRTAVRWLPGMRRSYRDRSR